MKSVLRWFIAILAMVVIALVASDFTMACPSNEALESSVTLPGRAVQTVRVRQRPGLFARRRATQGSTGGYGSSGGSYSYSYQYSVGYGSAGGSFRGAVCPNCGHTFTTMKSQKCNCCDKCTGQPGCQCGCADCTCEEQPVGDKAAPAINKKE